MGAHVPKSVAITTLYAQTSISGAQLFDCHGIVLSCLRYVHQALLFLLLRIRNITYGEIVMRHIMKSKGCRSVVLLKIFETKINRG